MDHSFKIPVIKSDNNSNNGDTKDDQSILYNTPLLEVTDVPPSPLLVEPSIDKPTIEEPKNNRKRKVAADFFKSTDKDVDDDGTIPSPPPPPKIPSIVNESKPTTSLSRNDSNLFNNSFDSFPEDLKKMLQPLFCQLCTVVSNSKVSAQMHYDSVQHQRRVQLWLKRWSRTTGEPVKLATVEIVKKGLFICDVCNISLTSDMDAKQHYNGRKHRLAASKNSNRFGIGESFVKQPEIVSVVTILPKTEQQSPPNTSPDEQQQQQQPSSSTTTTTFDIDPQRYCNVCKISVSHESQMAIHLNGSKHAKK